MGASLLVLAKSIYYTVCNSSTTDSRKLSHLLQLQLFSYLEFLDMASHIGGIYEPSPKYCHLPARSLAFIT